MFMFFTVLLFTILSLRQACTHATKEYTVEADDNQRRNQNQVVVVVN